MAGALEVTRHVDHRGVVHATFDDHVDFDRSHPGFGGGINAVQDLLDGKVDIVHCHEGRVIERIKTDRHSVQAGGGQGLCFAHQQGTVGRERQVGDLGYRCESGDEVLDAAS